MTSSSQVVDPLHPPVVRYKTIAERLRSQADNSPIGTQLPTEKELAAQFKVSRMTARQAVQSLEVEGLVHRRRGSGTFVALQPMHRHSGPLMSFTQDMQRRGKMPSSKLLRAELRAPSAEDAQALNVDGGGRVVSIARIRYADGVPIAIDVAALPSFCAPVLATDLENGSLHDALRSHGWVPTYARSWITARIATAKEADLLGIGRRGAILSERRIMYGAGSVPLEHTESFYAAERYVIDVAFAVDHRATVSSSREPVEEPGEDTNPNDGYATWPDPQLP